MQAGELIGHEVVAGDAPADTEVLGVGPRVHGAHRHHEAQAVGGGHLTTAPGARQGDPGLRRDEARVRRAQGLVAQVILADPGQAIAPQALSLVAHEWLEGRCCRLPPAARRAVTRLPCHPPSRGVAPAIAHGDQEIHHHAFEKRRGRGPHSVQEVGLRLRHRDRARLR